MKNVMKRAFIIATCAFFAVSISFGVYASDLEGAKGQLSSMEKKKKAMEDKIAALEKEKGNISAYIEKLDKQTAELDEQITALNDQIKETSTLLKKTRTELSNAQNTQQKQYEIMKARVKYVFENGSNDYLTMLLESSSLEDLLNNAEYISKISEYDQGLYTRYDETRQEIVKKEAEVSENLDKLNTLQQELQIQKDGLDTLLTNKQKEVKAYEDNITSNQASVNAYSKEIEKQEQHVQALIDAEKKRQEELRKKQEAEKKRREEEKRRQEEEKKNQDQQSSDNNNSGGSSGGNSSNNDNEDRTEPSGKLSFRWPLSVSGRITSQFGYRSDPFTGYRSYHNGLDIAAPKGTPILAAEDGVVIDASYQSAMGNHVVIYHNASYSTIYMHASVLKVSTGDKVSKGQVIALVGSTGRSSGNHLHFTIKCNGSYVDPEKYIR